MICGSCRRRCDPNRSFCTHCGSSVFIDERDALSRFASASREASSRGSSFLSSLQDTAKSLQGSAKTIQDSAKSVDRAALARRARARAGDVRKAAPAFSLAPLIRLVIFVWLVWYVGGWLVAIPEVSVLKDRVQAGHFSDADLQAAKDAIGARIQNFLRNAQDPNPPPAEPRQASAERTAEAPAAPTVPAERPAAVESPADTDSLPPGVSLPGDGVSMPRVLHKVNPEYTPQALRAKIEGTVLLQAVVRTHGVASDVKVLRSLDGRFGLDQQAVAALKQWRFAPGQRDGRSVPVMVQVEMNFSLK